MSRTYAEYGPKTHQSLFITPNDSLKEDFSLSATPRFRPPHFGKIFILISIIRTCPSYRIINRPLIRIC